MRALESGARVLLESRKDLDVPEVPVRGDGEPADTAHRKSRSLSPAVSLQSVSPKLEGILEEHMVWRCLQGLAVIGLTLGVVSARAETMIVRQVDHVLFATPNGRALVSLLTERLSLPIIWPQPGDDWTASTGIGLGNVTLEVFHRPPASPSEAPRPARINSLALQPTDLTFALQELQSRGIPHIRAEPGPRWTNVALRGFGHGLS